MIRPISALAAAVALVALGACATPPKPKPLQPVVETCGQIARKLENESPLTPAERKETVEKLKNQVFHWKLKVLNVSDETSRGEFVNGMAFTVECLDRPSVGNEGLRYIFTLYFERRVPELARLSKGNLITVDGKLTSYEGQGGFAGQALAYAIE